MIADAALFRAHLGAALRALPSELDDAPPRREGIAADALAVARELEVASPGLALMMQLRARLFDEAALEAGRRGFDALVAVGCGFDDRRLRRLARGRLRVVAIEHPAVLARRPCGRRSPAFARMPVEDLATAPCAALERQCGVRPGEHRTFVLLQGLSMWGGAAALAHWLDDFAAHAAPGSEMLLNVLDASTVAEAPSAAGAAGAAGGAFPASRSRSMPRLSPPRSRRAVSGCGDSSTRTRSSAAFSASTTW